MPSFLDRAFTDPTAKTTIGNATNWFERGHLLPLTGEDFTDWSKAVKAAGKAYPGASALAQAAARSVGGAVKAWYSSPYDRHLQAAVVSAINKMTTVLKDKTPTINDPDSLARYRDYHFSVMAVIARQQQSLTRPLNVDWESPEEAIINVRNILLADNYVEKCGVMPAVGRIAVGESPYKFWRAWEPHIHMSDAARTAGQQVGDIILQLDQGHLSPEDRSKELAKLAPLFAAMTTTTDPDRRSQAELAGMVIAETMRSPKLLPGGAERNNQPRQIPADRAAAVANGELAAATKEVAAESERRMDARRIERDKHPKEGRVEEGRGK